MKIQPTQPSMQWKSEIFPRWYGGRRVDLAVYLQLVLKLTMSRATAPLFHTPSCGKLN